MITCTITAKGDYGVRRSLVARIEHCTADGRWLGHVPGYRAHTWWHPDGRNGEDASMDVLVRSESPATLSRAFK